LEMRTTMCSSCNGRGHISRRTADGQRDSYACGTCRGTGRIQVRMTCQICLGAGGFDSRQVTTKYNGEIEALNKRLDQLYSNDLKYKVEQMHRLADDLNRRIDIWNSKFE